MRSWKVSATVCPGLGGRRLWGVMLAVALGGKGGWEDPVPAEESPGVRGRQVSTTLEMASHQGCGTVLWTL